MHVGMRASVSANESVCVHVCANVIVFGNASVSVNVNTNTDPI